MTPETKQGFLTLRVPASLVARLEAEAAANGRTRSEEHRAALELYLASRPLKRAA